MLADKIYNLSSFQRQFEAVQILSVSETISNLIWNEAKDILLSKIDWNNILSISSVLSYSDNNNHLDAALRISQTCLTQQSTSETQKNAAAIILENLTNRPAIALALDRKYLLEDYKSNYPLAFKLQTIESEIKNSIIVKDRIIHLNKFQKSVHDLYELNDTISISAPTSAGKSYILCTILLEELLDGVKNIVYLVPTRALISQVEFDLRELIKDNDLKDINISTVPQVDLDNTKSNVFVFTQERLHWFLIDNHSLRLDLLIVDEAHKIEDSNRGMLLQQKIEEVVSKFSDIKIYFSSPFTSNPEILLENVKNFSKKEKLNTQFVSVNQNLIYINQFPRKRDIWSLSLCLFNKKISLGIIKLHDKPDTEIKKITYIANKFSENNDGNIIYSNGAAEAEKTALLLYQIIKEETKSETINELIKLVKNTIHKDYALCKVLKKGIAFHYGNMPLLIRQEIERLFKNKEIRYLICTSTLLEGINLPAKSIFIRKPTRGRSHPLDQNDFWNLAGRAGRWGKEYSGNIICIEPHDWDIQPNPIKSKQLIRRAIDKIENNSDELIKYIVDGSPRNIANSRQDLEFAFGYYYSKYISGSLIADSDFYARLLELFKGIKKKVIIPDYIIIRNPGISPIAQQFLFDYFNTKIDEIEKLIPVHPYDVDTLDDYINLVGRIGKTLSEYPPQLNKPRAILLVNWMKGMPLSYLISSSYKWYQSQEKYKKEKNIAVVIREVMDNVETFVRFRFAKESSCYVDILRYFLELNDKKDLIENIPELNLWLEFGVSQKTHLSLLALGLSRNTVIELTSYITNSNMSKDESFEWIKNVDINTLELSDIIIQDIKRIL